MVLGKKRNTELNKTYIGYGLSLFFVVAIVFIKFGQSAIYEIKTFLESFNIRISPKGFFETIVPINVIFDMSQYVSIIGFVLNIIFVVVCTLPIFIFVIAYKVDNVCEREVTVSNKVCLREKTSYKVNERFRC